ATPHGTVTCAAAMQRGLSLARRLQLVIYPIRKGRDDRGRAVAGPPPPAAAGVVHARFPGALLPSPPPPPPAPATLPPPPPPPSHPAPRVAFFFAQGPIWSAARVAALSFSEEKNTK